MLTRINAIINVTLDLFCLKYFFSEDVEQYDTMHKKYKLSLKYQAIKISTSVNQNNLVQFS